MSNYEWTDDMREISGFGGGYELVCRAMVSAGAKWLDDNPARQPKFHGYKNITGIIEEDNYDAKALTEAVLNADVPVGFNGTPQKAREGCTGAMHQFTISHALHAHSVGWPEYQRIMRESRTEEEKSREL